VLDEADPCLLFQKTRGALGCHSIFTRNQAMDAPVADDDDTVAAISASIDAAIAAHGGTLQREREESNPHPQSPRHP
jgi:hypothetical protein